MEVGDWMETLYLNPDTGDLEFDGQNNLGMVDGIEEEKQSLRLLVSTNLGEWFLNEKNHGLDFSVIQVKRPDFELIEDAIKIALTQEPRVQEILSITLEFNRAARHLEINYEVRMSSGNVIEDRVVI